jgi:peptidoglycan/LPS O-acetylase OafA/YrhL
MSAVIGSRSHRLPGLDGLRAVSIALVIGVHVDLCGSLPRWASAFFQHGAFGVEIFFTISGLLITWLLLREEAAHGSISLRQFYARRAVRILPPAVTYLAVILVVSLLHHSMIWKPWISALLFYRNFDMSASTDPGFVDTGHYWSLSTEEQFYLIWPLLFSFLRSGMRVPFLLALLVAVPAWRWIDARVLLHGPANSFRIDHGCDGILMGCLVACAMEDRRYGRWLSAPVFRGDSAALAALLIIAATFTHWALTHPGQIVYPGIRAACVGVILYRVIRRSDRMPSVIDWVLNLNVLVLIGQLSYSLYLWQHPFCMPNGLFRTRSSSLNVTAALLCAVASFLLVERPSQALRRRLGSRTTPPASRPVSCIAVPPLL